MTGVAGMLMLATLVFFQKRLTPLTEQIKFPHLWFFGGNTVYMDLENPCVTGLSGRCNREG